MNDAAFPYRLAACDLDGTLLGPHKEISAANFDAVQRLRAHGVRVVLASGRRHQNSLHFYRQLQMEGLMISCSGALVKDPDTEQIRREIPLPEALADELVGRGQAGGFTVVYYHREHLFVGVRNHCTELYESRVGERAELFPGDLRELKGAAALKIVWYGEPDALQTRRTRLQDEYRERVTVLSTDAENLEFLAPAANKADALSSLAAFYGVGQAETLTFGDGENDAPMLRWAGLGVAVDGASEVARTAAKLAGGTGVPEERFSRAVDAVFSCAKSGRGNG